MARLHPATVAVEGVIDRPIRLSDVVRERAQIGARLQEVMFAQSQAALRKLKRLVEELRANAPTTTASAE